MPEFSIIIPTYNRAHLVGETIRSVLDQTYVDFEIIIIDDGSTDNTKSVVSDFSDERIRYHKIVNSERATARNTGVSKANSDYVYFLDSDDLLYPHHLQTAAEYLKSKSSPILWLPYEQVNAQKKVTRPYRPLRKPVFDSLVQDGNFMSCHGVFVKREILIQQPFNEDRALSGSEDMELWIRLAARYEVKIGEQVTSCLVEHDDRSVMNFNNIDDLIIRKELMLKYLLEDEKVRTRLDGKESSLKANAYSYIALHCMMNSHTSQKIAWDYFFRSARLNPLTLMNKRSLAIIKHSIFRTFASNER